MTTPAKPRRIFRRLLIGLAFTVALLVTLYVLFCMEERWRHGRAWVAYRAEATARGVKFDIHEILPPPLADADNFATTPMMRAIFEAQEKGLPQPVWFAALKWNAEGRPDFGNAAKNKPFQLTEWRDFFVKQKVIPAATDNAPADVLRALAVVEPELAELRSALSRKGCRAPLKWEQGFAMSLPHLAALRSAVNVFRLSSAAKLEAGDATGALTDVRAQLDLYRMASEEPLLISGLVAKSLFSSAADNVRHGLERQAWREAELAELDKIFAALDLAACWKNAMAGERATMNTTFEALKTKSASEIGKTFLSAGIDDHAGLAFGVLPRSWFDASLLYSNRYHDAWNVSADAMLAGQSHDMGEFSTEGIQRKNANLVEAIPVTLALLTIPALDSTSQTFLYTLADRQNLRTSIALELFRKKHGAFPASLAELNAAPEITRDPVDFQPLRYRRTEKGCELWSIGSDRRDDGGKEDSKLSRPRQPDWVWRMK